MMNTTFESPIKKVDSPAEAIYGFLGNFNSFGGIVQNEKIKEWQSTDDTCRFVIDGVGELGLKIIEREPCKTIKYTADGKTPFNFFLWVQIKELDVTVSQIKLTIKADMNPMMKMIASQPIQKFLDMISDAIANHKF